MDERELITAALDALPVSDLSREEWIRIGMALKESGYEMDLWDSWSRNDSRYKAKEIPKIWKSFKGDGNPVTAGTIVHMAEERGWTPPKHWDGDGLMDWDDVIEYDGDESAPVKEKEWFPAAELIKYLETLFEPDDKVGYVVTSSYDEDRNKWQPNSAGNYDRTRDELIEEIRKYPNDIGAALGDWQKEAGAWIRINPLDGKGGGNKNVTAYRFALVESDTMSLKEQEAFYRMWELPIAAMVNSGGKSIHAIVHIDAKNEKEYRARVKKLFDFLGEHNFVIDMNNSNPARLSRMPGITRGEKRQFLMATNVGRQSWDDWMDFLEGVENPLPDIVTLSDFQDNIPDPPEEIIEGVLRRGHKALISGPSKAGKSFLLMELCVAFATGTEWLGIQCKKGKILYVNLEIDERSCVQRFNAIAKARKCKLKDLSLIKIWNLRGCSMPLDKMVPKLIRKMQGQDYMAFILDPIYKVITGDENTASDMGYFCNQFDTICRETGASAIYCHHHSKGAQGSKRAMDRSSGSGVFARDPDALLDIIQLELTDEIRNSCADEGATGWRLEANLREFRNIKPVNFWFNYPLHELDETGELEKLHTSGSQMGNLDRSSKRTSASQRKQKLDMAYDACKMNSTAPKVSEIAEYMDITPKSVRSYVKDFEDDYRIDGGLVFRIERDDENDDE